MEQRPHSSHHQSWNETWNDHQMVTRLGSNSEWEQDRAVFVP